MRRARADRGARGAQSSCHGGTSDQRVSSGLWIGLVIVGLVGVSVSLARTRLVLSSLLDEPMAAPVTESSAATSG
jgi:hypothetical protein